MTKTIEQIKNEVAQRYGYEDWVDIIEQLCNRNVTRVELLKFTDEAMIEWGNQCKEAQRESDAKEAQAYLSQDDIPLVAKGSILNNPLVTDKIK